MHGQPLQPIPRTGWVKAARKLSVEPVNRRDNTGKGVRSLRSRQPLLLLGEINALLPFPAFVRQIALGRLVGFLVCISAFRATD